ncbi:MAG: DUF1266 domain-containing protein [Deltaproteobacteria bacterium]|nr:DUF1266 domain-containing protein [Kofleriaceae bacterium]
MDEQRRRWVLALAAVIDAVDRARAGEAVDDPAWCAKVLRDRHRVDSAAKLERRLAWLEDEGDTRAAQGTSLPGNPKEDGAREAVVRKHRQEILRAGLLAWDTAALVAVCRWAVRAGIVDEAAVRQRVLMAGYRCQRAYASWRAFGEAFELGRLYTSGGQGHKATAQALAWLLEAADSPWQTLPWALDLGLAGTRARARFRRARCPSCGGIKTQPSRTAYVYCDFCGELCDFDFEHLDEQPAGDDRWKQQQDRATRRLKQAYERDDRDAYRAAQERYWDAYVDAFPASVSPRVADPDYRRAWCAYQAEATTLWAFDAHGQRLDEALAAAVGELPYVQAKGKAKVVAGTFAPVLDAFEARRAWATKLYADSGVLARHPDGVSPQVSARIEAARFVQTWLPYLDEDTLRETIERLGVATDYDAAGNPGRGATVPCNRCGVALQIARGARRVVCEHCGHRLDLVAPAGG